MFRRLLYVLEKRVRPYRSGHLKNEFDSLGWTIGQRNVFIPNKNLFITEKSQECLLSSGFLLDDITKIFKECPELQSSTNLNQALSTWAHCKFEGQKLTDLLILHPKLLLVHPSKVRKLTNELSFLFSNDYVYKIILNAPDVMYQDWSTIKAKLDYLITEMKVKKSEVVNSGVVHHPLVHLKERLEMVVRTGIFKPGASTNPRLDTIINTSDEDFAKNVALVTPLEFYVFQELYREELSDEES